MLPDIPSEGREALSPLTHALPSSSGLLVSLRRKLLISFSLNSLLEGACLPLSDNVQSSPRWVQEECPDSRQGEQIPVALAAASLQVGFVPRGEIKSQPKQDY